MERHACPGPGACGGQFTANTMSMVLPFLGLTPLGANDIPAMHADKPAAAKACGVLVLQPLRQGGPTPRVLLPAVALHNAARAALAQADTPHPALNLLTIPSPAGAHS